MYTFEFGESLVIGIKDIYGTILSTCSTAGTFLLINVPRSLEQGNCEIPRLALDSINLGTRDDRYVRIRRALNKFGRQDTHGAIIGGKGLIQLGHLATNSRSLIYQIDPETGIGYIECGLYSTDSGSKHHHCPHLAFSLN
jgi:hypothetical protein